MSFRELADALAQLANRRENFAVQIQLQELPRETVGDPNVLVADDQTAGEAAILVLPDIVSILVKDLNPLILAVCHP